MALVHGFHVQSPLLVHLVLLWSVTNGGGGGDGDVTLTGNNCTQTVTLTPPFYEVQEFRVRQAPGLRCVITFAIASSSPSPAAGWIPSPPDYYYYYHHPWGSSTTRFGRSLFRPGGSDDTRRGLRGSASSAKELFRVEDYYPPPPPPSSSSLFWATTDRRSWPRPPPQLAILANAIPVAENNVGLLKRGGFQVDDDDAPWSRPFWRASSPWFYEGWWGEAGPLPSPPPPRLLLQLKDVDVTPGVFTCEFGGVRVYSVSDGLPTLTLTVCGSQNTSTAVLPVGGIAILTYTSSTEVTKGSGFTVSVQSIQTASTVNRPTASQAAEDRWKL